MIGEFQITSPSNVGGDMVYMCKCMTSCAMLDLVAYDGKRTPMRLPMLPQGGNTGTRPVILKKAANAIMQPLPPYPVFVPRLKT